MHSSWKELLEKLGITGTDWSLIGAVCLWRNLYNAYNTDRRGTASIPVELTSDELNAMWCACGYVPRSLLKKYEIKCRAVYSQFVQCLGDMAVEGEGDDVLTQGSGSIKSTRVVYSLSTTTRLLYLLKYVCCVTKACHMRWFRQRYLRNQC